VNIMMLFQSFYKYIFGNVLSDFISVLLSIVVRIEFSFSALRILGKYISRIYLDVKARPV